MTYTQAKLVIWNPRAYTRREVVAAVAFILGTYGAAREDIYQTCNLV